MSIGQRIKEKRLERGWSQRDLAARMGYSNHSTLAKIETGKVDLNQSKIAQFADVLGTTPSYLMGWEDKKEKPAQTDELSEKKKILMRFVESVPEEKADLVLRVIRSIVEAEQ